MDVVADAAFACYVPPLLSRSHVALDAPGGSETRMVALEVLLGALPVLGGPATDILVEAIEDVKKLVYGEYLCFSVRFLERGLIEHPFEAIIMRSGWVLCGQNPTMIP